MTAARPLPVVNATTAPFWEACGRGRLMIQKCTACAKHVFYPRVCCPHCHAGELDWVEASGTGRIVTFTHVQRPQHEFFYAEAPLCFVAVQLAEGPVMYGHLLNAKDGREVKIGAPVAVVFEAARPGLALPSFKRTT